MKAIICGGRDYKMDMADHAALSSFANTLGITEVVSGGAPGADAGGEAWARSRQIPVKRFPADWAKHGKSAGPIRNEQMAQYAQICIAFAGGRGTADMIHRARQHSLHVFESHEFRSP